MQASEGAAVGAIAPPVRLNRQTASAAMPALTQRTKLAFGLGAIAPPVTTGAFEFFLLIFYSQVVGLDARLVGLAIIVALISDAIGDPIVGYWSGNFSDRTGTDDIL